MERIDGVRASEPEKLGRGGPEVARLGAEAILTDDLRRRLRPRGPAPRQHHPDPRRSRDPHRPRAGRARSPTRCASPGASTFMALAQRHGEELARLFYAYAPSVSTRDYAAFEHDIVSFFDDLYGESLGDVEVSVIVGGTMAILRRHRVQIDPTFTVVDIALLVAEGLGKQLDPDPRPRRDGVPVLGSRARRSSSRQGAEPRDSGAIRESACTRARLTYGALVGKLLLLFTVVPLVELYLLLVIGSSIGFWPTVAIVLTTGLLGAWLAKSEGLRVYRKWQASLAQGRLPEEGVLGGLLVLVGGVLLDHAGDPHRPHRPPSALSADSPPRRGAVEEGRREADPRGNGARRLDARGRRLRAGRRRSRGCDHRRRRRRGRRRRPRRSACGAPAPHALPARRIIRRP